jgi:hypothetical protein
VRREIIGSIPIDHKPQFTHGKRHILNEKACSVEQAFNEEVMIEINN